MDTAVLLSARSLFCFDAMSGWSLVSKFTSLSTEFPTFRGEGLRFDEDFIRRQLLCATHDIWMMSTALARLAWMNEQAVNDAALGTRWSSYASLDIESWHSQFRSLLDYVAGVIRELAQRKDQVSDSFTTLWERASGKTLDREGGDPKDTVRGQESCLEFEKKLGTDWLELLKTATWYPQGISIRDQTVHFGAQTMVFGEASDGILFQVVGKRGDRLAHERPDLMFNNNVVHFDRYAAYFTACLLTWLEKYACIAYGRLGMMERQGSFTTHFGFEVLVKWVDALISRVRQA